LEACKGGYNGVIDTDIEVSEVGSEFNLRLNLNRRAVAEYGVGRVISLNNGNGGE
jgi:hypothetical protein